MEDATTPSMEEKERSVQTWQEERRAENKCQDRGRANIADKRKGRGEARKNVRVATSGSSRFSMVFSLMVPCA